MKGTIHYCLEETIITRYGQEAWDKICVSLGMEEGFSYGTKIRDDIDEVQSIELFVLSSNILDIPLNQLFDDFGEHWCVEYSPKVYGVFYRGMTSTRDAILKLDEVHDRVTRHIQGAYPPRFGYNWLSNDVLEVEYRSDRNLIDLFISLIKGLDKKFDNQTEISKVDDSHIRLKFDAQGEDPLRSSISRIERMMS